MLRLELRPYFNKISHTIILVFLTYYWGKIEVGENNIHSLSYYDYMRVLNKKGV